MLRANPKSKDGFSNAQQIVKACASFMKTKIITSENDKIGLVLFGCKHSSNSLSLMAVDVAMKLDTPDAEAIKKIEILQD